MTDPLHVDSDGVRNLARVQSDVASALDDAIGVAASEIAGFEQRYGPIAEPARHPLREILDARADLLNTLSRTSSELADRLTAAARAYDTADDAEAAALRDSDLDGER